MPLKEKNRTKTKIAPPGAFSVASPCTFCSLQAAQPGGSSLSSTPCPGPRRGGLPSPCWGAQPTPSRHQRCHRSAPPAQLLSPCSSLTYIPAWTRAPLTFSLLLFQLSAKKILLQARGGFISSTRGQCSCKGGLCAPRGTRWPPKANHGPGCLQTSSFTRGPPSLCP